MLHHLLLSHAKAKAMIELILEDISNNWQELILEEKPHDPSFLQISSSPGKRFNKGRLIYLIFEKGNIDPIICAKLCRDPAYQSSLEEEFEILEKLHNQASPQIAQSIPKPIKITTLDGRKVMYESPTLGKLANKILSDTLAIDPAEFKVITADIFNTLSYWLSELYSSTKINTITINNHFAEEFAEPIVKEFTKILKLGKAEQEPYYNFLSEFKNYHGKSLPVVTTHGNLFSCNVMLTDDKRMNIIDWKSSQQTPLILRDIYCFALHTFYDFQRLGIFGSPDMLQNFKEVFIEENANWFSQVVSRSVRSLYQRLDIDEDIHKLFFPLYLMNEVKVQYEYSPLIELGASSIEKDFVDLYLGLEVEYVALEQTLEHIPCEMLIDQNKDLNRQLQQKENEIAHLMEAVSAKDTHIKNLEDFIFKVRRTLPFRVYQAIKNVIIPPNN